ncbi:dTDP-glucose 4,6-dehydratase [Oceanicola granulosus HTCC2516]|uniref:dTDP-glucose 4,6-dehydratase n=1 Tax=Oceanicola granulosus (strain ATCC BAA-861 / DSM 15982 / KCTC 12143 / HTCC2516) TaxID=314256 RepID=Q2CH86_OCEGH|nr:NAD(P)-dependent oxidoreductase [Oceanicola granulosus]EAR51925.1 dTDP-glucose 4,6-dehydratase [Oceanicola granulosus HTCC2516]
MRVLVTGGAGLIGMALRRGLAAAGHEVVAVDITDFGRDDPGLVLLPLSDIEGLARLADARRIEAIVHGGGVSGPMMMRDDPAGIVATNTVSTAALLDIARRREARFLLLSSHVVYGETGDAVIDEDRPPRPTTTYAASKAGADALVASFRHEFAADAASLRLTRVYGAYRRANCFLRQAILDAAAGRETVIKCDPDFPYHYLYVEDIVGAVAAALAAPKLAHPVYDVTSGEILFMPEIADILRATLPGARITLVPGRDDAPEVQAAFAARRLTADTGWHPAWPLRKGLADYAARLAAEPGAAG